MLTEPSKGKVVNASPNLDRDPKSQARPQQPDSDGPGSLCEFRLCVLIGAAHQAQTYGQQEQLEEMVMLALVALHFHLTSHFTAS